MSKDRIKEIAVQHFNRYGYEGVRMAQIAEDAGIRKQSLSYHFSTKKALLEELYEEVVEEEISFVRSYFVSRSGLAWEEQLYQFLVEHKNRFVAHPNVHFMFVISFLTPTEVNDFVVVQYQRYLAILREEVDLLFAQGQSTRIPPEECTVAYMTLLDGLDVQLVYETLESYERALKIGWNVLLHGTRL
ncbi:TetR/AcrR family transcriptional regulator [Paenibacillus sp. HW567]|uniref:TetR/AcrR family transcriptional regulator n=1 Tax=Paenibacillus sp. HW567 TaxID=1034769 RepID=UPI00036C42E6|nr:TetR/AcrR family transcriptional regulator [Paenibacillus sp. HW567]